MQGGLLNDGAQGAAHGTQGLSSWDLLLSPSIRNLLRNVHAAAGSAQKQHAQASANGGMRPGIQNLTVARGISLVRRWQETPNANHAGMC